MRKWTLFNLLAVAIWGSQYMWAAKIVEEVPPFALAFLRFTLALIFVLIFSWRKFIRSKILTKDILKIVFISLLGFFCGTLAMIHSIKLANTVVASSLINTNPVWIALLAPWLIGEKVSMRQKFGIFIAFLGVVLLILNGQNLAELLKSEYFLGSLIAISGALGISLYTLYIKRFILKYNSTIVNVLGFGSAMILSLIATAFTESQSFYGSIDLITWSYILVYGLFTGLTFLLWSSSIKHLGASGAGYFKVGIPVFATIYSLMFLDETLSNWMLSGFILVLLGIISVYSEKDKNIITELD